MRNLLKLVNAQLLVGICFGGFAGSLLTWFLNRPNPTVITYAVTTTSLGADATVRSLIPNLKLQVGTEEIPVIHTHNIEFDVPGGDFLDQAEVAITFQSPVRSFGRIVAEAPSLVHRIDCKPVRADATDELHLLGVRCSMSPMKPNTGRFRVAIATDSREQPTVAMAIKNATLVRAEQYLLRSNQILGIDVRSLLLALNCAGFAGAMILVFLINKLSIRSEKRNQRLSDLEKRLPESTQTLAEATKLYTGGVVELRQSVEKETSELRELRKLVEQAVQIPEESKKDAPHA